MPIIDARGTPTRYEVEGQGPPLLWLSPGGFDGALDNWRSMGRYRGLRLVDELSRDHRCILFDKRESGASGGAVERLSWSCYADQALGLLDHLQLRRAHLIGGCVGCSVALEIAVRAPDRVASLVLFQPAGGPRYRLKQQERLARHAAFAREQGLSAVVEVAAQHDQGFASDPRVGPWVTLIRNDTQFAETFADRDVDGYVSLVLAMARTMFDRDTVPGPDADALLQLVVPTLVIPGADTSHAPSAAHYLHECIHGSDLWSAAPSEQSSGAAERIASFLRATDV